MNEPHQVMQEALRPFRPLTTAEREALAQILGMDEAGARAPGAVQLMEIDIEGELEEILDSGIGQSEPGTEEGDAGGIAIREPDAAGIAGGSGWSLRLTGGIMIALGILALIPWRLVRFLRKRRCAHGCRQASGW